MSGGKSRRLALLALAVVAIVVVVVIGVGHFLGGEGAPSETSNAGGQKQAPIADVGSGKAGDARQNAQAAKAVNADEKVEAESESKDEAAEDKGEKAVEDFDAMVDKWMDAEAAHGVATLKDVPQFVSAFKQIPKDRQDECIHRALNLVPDENVILLAGILLDKTVDKEIVETVYNDILNRDEKVKQPILKLIYKDKTHSCWATTAWILDVTGEKE